MLYTKKKTQNKLHSVFTSVLYIHHMLHYVLYKCKQAQHFKASTNVARKKNSFIDFYSQEIM